MPEEMPLWVSPVVVMDEDGGTEAVAGLGGEVESAVGDGGLVDCLAFVAGDGEGESLASGESGGAPACGGP